MLNAINIKKLQITSIVKQHIISNLREYIIVSLVFMIGVFLSVMFVNNMEDTQKKEISDYINNYVDSVKNQGSINNQEVLKENIKVNFLLALGLWFAGTTII